MDAEDVPAARTRVGDARALAAAGLDEARRAVAALRAPQPDDAPAVDPAALRTMLDDLVEAHRALGARGEFTESGSPRPVPSAVATALQRALQEALSNARRHAPGQPVSVVLDWRADRVVLSIANPVAGPASAGPAPTRTVPSGPGGGYGLVGMRERFAALSAGGTVRLQRDDDRFVLIAEAIA
jgi:signal transduction histidine kinase